MSVRRGEVVLIDAPFVTRPGSKIRPMLVVQCDTNNQRMGNTILALVTTNTSRASEPTQVMIDVATPAGQASGLLANSVVSCENLITVRQAQIRRTIGQLPTTAMDDVNLALKSSLNLL